MIVALFANMIPTARHSNLFDYLRASYPDKVPAFLAYEDAVAATGRRKNQWRFLKDCLEEHVLPSSYAFLLKGSISGSPFPPVARFFLEERIQAARLEVEEAYHRSRTWYRSLVAGMELHDRPLLADFAHQSANRATERHGTNLSNKLQSLISLSPWASYTLTESVANLSDTPLPPHSLELLGLGLSFSTRPDAHSSIDLISSLDRFLTKNPSLDCPSLRGALIPALQTLSSPNLSLPRRYRQALVDLRRMELTILPSDKGNQVVILDTSTYLEKALDLLSDGTTYRQLSRNPGERVATTFHRRLQEIGLLCPEANLYQRFRVINPLLPHAYFLIKTHKPPLFPVRPIIIILSWFSYLLPGRLPG